MLTTMTELDAFLFLDFFVRELCVTVNICLELALCARILFYCMKIRSSNVVDWFDEILETKPRSSSSQLSPLEIFLYTL